MAVGLQSQVLLFVTLAELETWQLSSAVKARCSGLLLLVADHVLASLDDRRFTGRSMALVSFSSCNSILWTLFRIPESLRMTLIHRMQE